MGSSISIVTQTVREEAKRANREVKAELDEQLKFLEIAAEGRLKAKLPELLHGNESDLQIHGGTVVEQHNKISIDVSQDERELEAAIDDMFGGGFFKGIERLAKTALKSILGNGSIGQSEQQDFIILWAYNSLMRVDFYCWRYNFSAGGAIAERQNVFAYAVVKRVLDWNKVDPQVVAYSLSNAENLKGEELMKEIDQAVCVLKKIKSASDELTK